ncbi:erythromycin esterase family protein [Cumulibacter manganitolerans]|uniref:erythromycin esterase family protein n=1 Tax=Cumulibacter manganitolerans TaxID=1884992 RepID=UPI0012973137|nr:erythromycin esterase family protein [Cumulibacter manganitolerans]
MSWEPSTSRTIDREALAQVRALARPLSGPNDLEAVVNRFAPDRFVCIGEASHGTHEYYSWRAQLTRRLIEEKGFTWIGVEGDWPDCWRINRWVRGEQDQALDARGLLAGFQRWPTWMWANEDVADFLDWLHRWNLGRPTERRVGFYGLDVYSLWDSLRAIRTWLDAYAPEAVSAAIHAWQCFWPYGEDPHRYARAARLVPQSCEAAVVSLLVETLRRTRSFPDDEFAFDAMQNAQVAVGAERYYRVMLRGDRSSWNIRDHHMADTIDRIARHLGPTSQGIIWEHNSHIGDARATDMAHAGLVNVGQLVRDRHATEGVGLIGFAGHRGSVLAARAWGGAESCLPVPKARPGTHEDVLHRALGRPAILDFGADRSGSWLAEPRGHRAIGVVYDPAAERGNYVATAMGRRYDALFWLEETTALRPLHHETRPIQPELEAEPSGL